jgi:hypothetical protein
MTVSKTLLALAAVALSIASSAFAAGVPNNGAAAAARQAAEGAQPLSGTTARMAVLYSPFNGIIRSKGVASVNHIATGINCITPMVAIRQTKFYQSVSVDWGWSSGSSLVVMTRDNADGFTDCPNAGDFEVMTFDPTGAASDSVGFFYEVL